MWMGGGDEREREGEVIEDALFANNRGRAWSRGFADSPTLGKGLESRSPCANYTWSTTLGEQNCMTVIRMARQLVVHTPGSTVAGSIP
jgi:hypothetical protein